MRLEFMGMTLKENNRNLNGRVQVLSASRKHDKYTQKWKHFYYFFSPCYNSIILYESILDGGGGTGC